MQGVIYGTDHAHCILSTWLLHRLATNVPVTLFSHWFIILTLFFHWFITLLDKVAFCFSESVLCLLSFSDSLLFNCLMSAMECHCFGLIIKVFYLLFAYPTLLIYKQTVAAVTLTLFKSIYPDKIKPQNSARCDCIDSLQTKFKPSEKQEI